MLDGRSCCADKCTLDLALIAVKEEKTQRGEDVPERVGLNDMDEHSSSTCDLTLVYPQRQGSSLDLAVLSVLLRELRSLA